MDELTKGLLQDFSKEELLAIAEELEIKLPKGMGTMARGIIQSVYANLDKEGVPDATFGGSLATDEDEVSELLFDFLLAAEYVDEDGNILEDDETEEKGGDAEEIEELPDDLPECFGYAEIKDPACRKCKIYNLCAIERIGTRPECFGVLFKLQDEECLSCIEANECQQARK